jgi:hypothetical protein
LQLNLAGSGKLDVTNDEVIVPAPASTVQSYLKNGQLFTSAAGGILGYLDLGNGQTEVRFTLAGDTNLDQSVGVGDLGALATNYGKTANAVWAQGDFNNDGKIDVGDLGLLATNYGQTLGGGGVVAAAATEAPAADGKQFSARAISTAPAAVAPWSLAGEPSIPPGQREGMVLDLERLLKPKQPAASV